MEAKTRKITALIQARLGSSRLPAKTLMTIKGETLLGHLVGRIKASKYVSEIVIATTTKEIDDAIVRFATDWDIKYYRGSEDDVLDRFYQTALHYNIETVVRVTPDCPMLDPKIMDKVISHFLEGNYDYVSNVMPPTYPDGLDTEIFSFDTLKKGWNAAKLHSEREHVTAFIIKHPKLFRQFNVKKEGEDLSWMRWTVDTQRDFEFVSKIFEKLYIPRKIFYMDDIICLLKENSELLEINREIERNEGYRISLLKDKEYEKNSYRSSEK